MIVHFSLSPQKAASKENDISDVLREMVASWSGGGEVVVKSPVPLSSFIPRDSSYHLEAFSWAFAETAFLISWWEKSNSLWSILSSQKFLLQKQMNEQADLLIRYRPCLQRADCFWRPLYIYISLQ